MPPPGKTGPIESPCTAIVRRQAGRIGKFDLVGLQRIVEVGIRINPVGPGQQQMEIRKVLALTQAGVKVDICLKHMILPLEGKLDPGQEAVAWNRHELAHRKVGGGGTATFVTGPFIRPAT